MNILSSVILKDSNVFHSEPSCAIGMKEFDLGINDKALTGGVGTG